MDCAPDGFSGAPPTLVDKLDSRTVEEKITAEKSRIGLQSKREDGSTGGPLRVCAGREGWCEPPSARSERWRHRFWNHQLHHGHQRVLQPTYEARHNDSSRIGNHFIATDVLRVTAPAQSRQSRTWKRSTPRARTALGNVASVC